MLQQAVNYSAKSYDRLPVIKEIIRNGIEIISSTEAHFHIAPGKYEIEEKHFDKDQLVTLAGINKIIVDPSVACRDLRVFICAK